MWDSNADHNQCNCSRVSPRWTPFSVRIALRQINPGMVCLFLSGLQAADAHNVMQGLVPEKKVFDVHIEQGHKHASKIVLRGEAGHSEPGVEPGDVIFVLEQKQHKFFRRIHSDLVYEKVHTPLFPVLHAPPL